MSDTKKINLSSLKQSYTWNKWEKKQEESAEMQEASTQEAEVKIDESNNEVKKSSLKLKLTSEDSFGTWEMTTNETSKKAWYNWPTFAKKEEVVEDENAELFVNYESSFSEDKKENKDNVDKSKEINEEQKWEEENKEKKESTEKIVKKKKRKKVLIWLWWFWVASLAIVSWAYFLIPSKDLENIETNVWWVEEVADVSTFEDIKIWLRTFTIIKIEKNTWDIFYEYDWATYSNFEDLEKFLKEKVKKETNIKIKQSVKDDI